ncbi:CHAP domain-containing protein [Actinomadura logoneensis]|uniref:CHAP domain-containing protein n=1 Tax=Actinomadura logoneensis TaxID=2293572 RepID=A0A372J958_9ACTN|nr:CHAP domain-containing protein [Actinomadura logoneensis]RFU36356.1 CHAP domain-containing protein [Actinomadura logoneensis]
MKSQHARNKQIGLTLATTLCSVTLTGGLAGGPAASTSATAAGPTAQASRTAQNTPQTAPGITSGTAGVRLPVADKGNPAATVVRLAESQVGYHEKGNNCTKYGKWAGHECAEWCDIFVGWAFWKAGRLAAAGGKVYERVDDHLAWFKQHNRFHRRGAKGGGPRQGAVIFFDFNGHDGPDHVGIVVGYDSTHVETVEGNSGDQVRKHKYSRSSRFIWGYGYPAW